MNASGTLRTSRRDFLQHTGQIAAAGILSQIALPQVHASSDDTIQVALVGCGGRGSGAVADAFATSKLGPVKLVAMADVFENRLNSSREGLEKRFSQNLDVPPDRRFVGFDGYKAAMDALRPGDVVILATPPAFRWVHFSYAIQKGLNVFMEKPVTVDGPTSRRMLKLGEESEQKGLKVGVGLMVRHCRGRQELLRRVRDGEIGDIVAMRAYRMAGASARTPRNSGSQQEMLFQIQRFHSFLWASGGVYSDYYIHQIDECSWIKGAWPVRAHALGARQYRGEFVDQNLDTYAVEYTYPDGTKLFYDGRQVNGCKSEFASYAHGSRSAAVISTSSHTPGKVRIFKGQRIDSQEVAWAYPQPERSPYELEWEDLITAIRQNAPYNEVKRGVEASLVTTMGRFAAHTGQEVTFEQMLNHDHEFAPGLDQLKADSPAPVLADSDGRYPVPEPGINKNREYADKWT